MDLAEHLARIERDGYTIVEDAIEPALIDELAEDLSRLEGDLGAVPAKNIFEGTSQSRSRRASAATTSPSGPTRTCRSWSATRPSPRTTARPS